MVVEWLLKIHHDALQSYAHRPYSENVRVKLFLYLLYLILPVSWAMLVPTVIWEANWFNLGVVTGITVLIGVLFFVVQAGRAEVAAAVFSCGLSLILLFGHFTGDFSSLYKIDSLLLERLAYFGALTILLSALISNRFRLGWAILHLFLTAGSFQVFVLQLPSSEPEEVSRLMAAFVRFLLTLPLFATMTYFIQRISLQAVLLVEKTKASLEDQVAERTRYLEDVLKRLQRAQQGLIEVERLSVLGRLAANVAHEINTPLGAIRASRDNLLAALQAVSGHYGVLVRSLSPEAFENFLDLVREESRNSVLAGATGGRYKRKAWVERLAVEGVPSPEPLADLASELKLDPTEHRWDLLVRNQNAAAILEMAVNLVAIVHSAEIISVSTAKAADFVAALEKFSDQGRDGMTPEPVDLVANLETVLTLMRGEWSKKLTLERDYRTRPQVLAVPDQLMQVWGNLLQNAVQAMGGVGHLFISVATAGSEASVRVQDSGPGIPPEIEPRIFEPFVTAGRSGGGVGLGLSMARDNIQRAGGSIRYVTGPGGTVFTVTLPVLPEA